MARKRIILDLFAQVEVPHGTEPEVVMNKLARAAANLGWGFVGLVQPEDEAFKASLGLLSVQEEDDEESSDY